MHGKPSEERLSAWLDDELPLAERAEVEQQLAESPDMRQEAEELRQVSELVRSLPQDHAPEELQSAVMRSIERDTLLAGGESQSRRSVRLSQIISVAAVAVLLAGVTFLLSNGGGAQPDEDGPEIVRGHVPPPPIRAQHPEDTDTENPQAPAVDENDDKASDDDDESAEDKAPQTKTDSPESRD